MDAAKNTQRIPSNSLRPHRASSASRLSFDIGRRPNLGTRSLEFYRQKLTPFLASLAERGVLEGEAIAANHVRAFPG